MGLEYIIGIKAGIGRSFEEAEYALNKSKPFKPSILETDTPLEANTKTLIQVDAGEYALHFFNESELLSNDLISFKSRDELEEQVEKSLENLNMIRTDYGDSSSAYLILNETIQSQTIDYSTGALTPFGYLYNSKLEQEKIDSVLEDGNERFYVLFDANDMHFWNEDCNAGYEDVTRHINAFGKALVNSTRSGVNYESENDSPRDFVVKAHSYVSRTHGSAGDEFLVELYCQEDQVVEITKRLIDSCYEGQMKLYGKTMSDINNIFSEITVNDLSKDFVEPCVA